jgi:hypothetical protein
MSNKATIRALLILFALRLSPAAQHQNITGSSLATRLSANLN